MTEGIKIAGKKYQLNRGYFRKVKGMELVDLKTRVESIIGEQLNDDMLHIRKDITKDKNIKAFRKNLNFDEATYGDKLYKFRYELSQLFSQAQSKNANKNIYFMFRDEFTWPRNYFGDDTCWHTFNSGAPIMAVREMGAVFMTGYEINKHNKKVPAFRAVIFPDGTLINNTIIANTSNKNGITVAEIASLLSDSETKNLSFWNNADNYEVMYFHDFYAIMENKNITNGEFAKYKGGYVNIEIEDYKYKGKECPECHYKRFDEEVIPHICREYHPVNRRKYP